MCYVACGSVPHSIVSDKPGCRRNRLGRIMDPAPCDARSYCRVCSKVIGFAGHPSSPVKRVLYRIATGLFLAGANAYPKQPKARVA